MSSPGDQTVKFEGEDANSGYAAPLLDLTAAAFLVALSVVVMVGSVMLPVPGGLRTAPGLLPFLTGASLAVMAILLGVTAWKRRRAGEVMGPDEARDPLEDRGALLLALTVAIYIAGLQFLAFQHYFTLGGVHLILSAFEPVTIIALATIIHVFWRGPLWITAVISVGWTLTLSLVFQKLFVIPLPGGF